MENNNTGLQPESFSNAPHLRSVTLLDGRTVDVKLYGHTEIKTDTKNLTIDFSWNTGKSIVHESAIHIFLNMLTSHSLSYCASCVHTFGFLATYQKNCDCIEMSDINGFVECVPASYWPFLQATLNRWHRLDLGGLSGDVIRFLLAPEKFEEKGNGAYFTLIVNNPERGALTEQELKNIQNQTNSAFETGLIDTFEWALTWFFIATGVRPVQIARMTIKDVIITDGPEGREIVLAIPLAKGEKQVVNEKWKRKAPLILAEVLINYLRSPHCRNESPDVPLFFDQSIKLTNKLNSIFKRVNTYSERLEGPIPIFAYRFRYTFGTRAIALGASDHEVARLLMHRQTACIKYYRAAMPSLQKPIKKAIGKEMTFLAKAFRGNLIKNLSEATRTDDYDALIREFASMSGQRIGACGTTASCYQDAPRACLTCKKFEPFISAPWEELLDSIKNDMNAESEVRIKLIHQEQIDAVREIITERDQLEVKT